MTARRKRPGVPRSHANPRHYEVVTAAIVATSAALVVTISRSMTCVRTSLRPSPAGCHRLSPVRTTAITGRHVRRSLMAELLTAGNRRAQVNLIGIALALAPWGVIGMYSVLSRPTPAPNTALASSSVAPAVPSLDETIEIVPLDSPSVRQRTTIQVLPAHVMLHSEQQLVAVANRDLATTGLPTMPTIQVPPGAASIPRVALIAYVNAAQRQQKLTSYCNLNWSTLAAIGYVESDHAKSGGSASASWNGTSNPRILGPELNGTSGYAKVPDTDYGLLDGDTTYDRAVGPMQFLPSTWREYAVSANPGRLPNPENIFDATEAAGRYLCADGLDLRVPANLVAAIYGYNHSLTYVENVITVAGSYAGAKPADVAAAFAAAQTLFAPNGAQPVSAAETAIGIAPTPSGDATPTPSTSPTSVPVYWPVPPVPIGIGNPLGPPSAPTDPSPAPTTTGSAPASTSPSPSESLSQSPTLDPSPTPAPTPTTSPTATASLAPTASLTPTASLAPTPTPTPSPLSSSGMVSPPAPPRSNSTSLSDTQSPSVSTSATPALSLTAAHS